MTRDAGSRFESASHYSTQTRYNDDITNAAGAVVVPAGTRVVEQTTPATTVVMPDGTELTGARRTVTVNRPRFSAATLRVRALG